MTLAEKSQRNDACRVVLCALKENVCGGKTPLPPIPKATGKCWYVYNLLKYKFHLQFDIPVTYPSTAPELKLPQLDGKTQKIYKGGKICLTVHFKPLWAKVCPRFGIAHALCLGLAPWLVAEVPILMDSGMIKHKYDATISAES